LIDAWMVIDGDDAKRDGAHLDIESVARSSVSWPLGQLFGYHPVNDECE